MGDDSGVRSESESRTLLEGLAGDVDVANCVEFLKRGRGVGRGFMGLGVDVEGASDNSEAVAFDGRATELLGFNGVLLFPRFDWLTLPRTRGELSSSEPSVSSEKLVMAKVAARRGGIILPTKVLSESMLHTLNISW